VENGDLRANLLQKQAALQTQEAELASLKKGTRPEEIAVVEAAVENDRLTLEQANQGVVNAIQDAYSKSDDAIHTKVDQFLSNARSSSPQLNFYTSDTQVKDNLIAARVAMETTLLSWQNEAATLSSSDDIASAAAHAKSNLSKVTSLLASASTALSRAIPNSSVTQTSIDGYATDVATGRANVNTAISTLNTALTTRASATATLAKDEKTLALNKAGSTSEDVAAKEAQVKAAQADVESARAQLAKTIVVAPFSGTITKMDAKVGAIVSSNTSQISMISSGTFQIESYVPEVNVARLEVGDTADVTLDAYGETVLFAARIVSINPAETVRDGVSTYKTILEFVSKDDRVRSGMTANVRITTEKKADVVSIPQGLVVERDGKKFVTVQTGDTTTETQITTGSISSLGNIEILSGLKEGDIVVVPN
jgi:HlyD family secretion protein